IPICIPYALFLVWQGIPQTLGAYVDATTLEGAKQTIAVGPVASQVAIKMLGTNGGGFFNANAAHPFENPTALSNLIQIVSIFAIGAGLTNVFGRMVGSQSRVALARGRLHYGQGRLSPRGRARPGRPCSGDSARR